MNTFDTKSDVVNSIKHTIEKNNTNLESISNQCYEVKLEIQNAMKALYSALRTREAWLLSHVDLIASSHESIIRKKQYVLHELCGFLSNKQADDADRQEAIDKLGECYSNCLELSFDGEIKEFRRQLLGFGRINCDKNTSPAFQLEESDDCPSKENSFEIDKFSLIELQENKCEIISESFSFENNNLMKIRSKVMSPNEIMMDAKDVISESYRFDFTLGKFVKVQRKIIDKEIMCSSEINLPSPIMEEIKPLESFCFDFCAERFVSVPNKDDNNTNDPGKLHSIFDEGFRERLRRAIKTSIRECVDEQECKLS